MVTCRVCKSNRSPNTMLLNQLYSQTITWCYLINVIRLVVQSSMPYQHQPDIRVITESKFDSTINNSEFLPQNVNVYIHGDRTLNGGGVIIAFRNTLVLDETTIKHFFVVNVVSQNHYCSMQSCYRVSEDLKSCDGLNLKIYRSKVLS